MTVCILPDHFGVTNMTKALQIIACVCVVGYALVYTGVQGHGDNVRQTKSIPYPKYDKYPYKQPYIPGYFGQSMANEKKKAHCVGSFYCGVKNVGHNKIEECVSSGMVCNGMRDCLNGADERGCPPQCHQGVMCNDKKKCGTPCDGKKDCSGGEDEDCPASCLCGEGTIKCLNEDLCLPTKKVCDGHTDCLHGNDEEDCSPACLCKEGSYLCKDGKACVSADKFCDGSNQCTDEDDETNCPATCFCPKGSYNCQTFEGEDPICITKGEFCDDNDDCPRRDDEDLDDHCGNIGGA